MTATGQKASSRTRFALSGTCSKSVGFKRIPSQTFPVKQVAQRERDSSIQSPSLFLFFRFISPPISVDSLRGSPTFMNSTLRMSFSLNSS